MTASFDSFVTGDEQFRRAMESIVQFAKRPSLAMRAMAGVLEDETEENFKDQGRPEWRALSEAAKFGRIGGRKGYKKDGRLRARSQRVLESMMILQDTGKLASSVHSQFGDDFAMIGAATPYARIHQMGGKAGKGLSVTIPARPYLPFTPDLKLQTGVEQELLKIAMEHLHNATTT